MIDYLGLMLKILTELILLELIEAKDWSFIWTGCGITTRESCCGEASGLVQESILEGQEASAQRIYTYCNIPRGYGKTQQAI